MSRKTLARKAGFLTLIAGASLIGLACEAGQNQNTKQQLPPPCKRECADKDCPLNCPDCCHIKHPKNVKDQDACLERCRRHNKK